MSWNNWVLHTFHDSATVTGNGTALSTEGYRTLVVEIDSDVTSNTIEFKAKISASAYKSITGVNLGTLATATSTTGLAELWEFDVSCVSSVIMDLTAITAGGGSTNVIGKVRL